MTNEMGMGKDAVLRWYDGNWGKARRSEGVKE
jgi:hypothetical protein